MPWGPRRWSVTPLLGAKTPNPTSNLVATGVPEGDPRGGPRGLSWCSMESVESHLPNNATFVLGSDRRRMAPAQLSFCPCYSLEGLVATVYRVRVVRRKYVVDLCVKMRKRIARCAVASGLSWEYSVHELPHPSATSNLTRVRAELCFRARHASVDTSGVAAVTDAAHKPPGSHRRYTGCMGKGFSFSELW
eukprot:gene22887-biopygen14825